MIDQLAACYSVCWLCRQLGVARSGYNTWRQRQEAPGKRAAENAVITAEIVAVFEQHRGFYGSPRVHQELRSSGRQIGRHRVARLMRRAELRARTHKAFRPCAKASRGACGVVANLLQQDFQPPVPNLRWAGDITDIRTNEGWRYLAIWIDLFSRRVVGWTLDHRMDATLVIEALNRALGHRRVEPEQLLLHTDQGSQYRATDYRQLLESHKIGCSMSTKGCCWDNAVVESFFSTLTLELDLDDNREALISAQQLQRDLAFWIEGYYNRERRHSTIGYLSTIDCEQGFIISPTLTRVNP
ncbi:IS3 family transposase [Synechococcus sp. BA-124 BA4]|uniref:IS3 family transposase n=1 Tax=unclassified Synechococcus TaxID=2626047 RepID=UPI002AD49493|nr:MULTISPECIES: IS3 family transposase [unclassified Synechococcus]MEA5398443.1 IS3 family transposase [Synechococcus sp. BA-124 BA4]